MTTKELSPQQEQLVESFKSDLSMIDGPDDIFPPDNSGGVREPLQPILPHDSSSESLSLAAVYDLVQFKKKQTQVIKRDLGCLVLA